MNRDKSDNYYAHFLRSTNMITSMYLLITIYYMQNTLPG